MALLSQLRPSSLEVQDFARTFCVTQQMPWSFLVRKETVDLLAKVVGDTGIGFSFGLLELVVSVCGENDGHLAGRGCPLTKGW